MVKQEHDRVWAARSATGGGGSDATSPGAGLPDDLPSPLEIGEDPWSDADAVDEAQPWQGPEYARNNPRVPFYFAANSQGAVVQRQSLTFGKDGQPVIEISKKNQRAIEKVASGGTRVPRWLSVTDDGRPIPVGIEGVSHNGRSGQDRGVVQVVGGGLGQVHSSTNFADHLYVVNPSGTRAISLSESGMNIDKMKQQGHSIAMIAVDEQQGLPYLNYIGSGDKMVAAENAWRKSMEPGDSETMIPCEYCGGAHHPGTAVVAQHAALATRGRPTWDAVVSETELRNRVIDDLVDQARGASVSKVGAQVVDEVARGVGSGRASERKRPEYGDDFAHVLSASKRVIGRIAAASKDNPNRTAKGNSSSPDSYQVPGDDSTQDDNPLYSGGAEGPKRKKMPNGVPAPEMPGDIGSVHVPSLIASAVNRPGKPNSLGVCVGDHTKKISRAERNQALSVGEEWYKAQMVANAGLVPGSWRARRHLYRNRDKVTKFRDDMTQNISTAQAMRRLVASDPSTYYPGSSALRKAYLDDTKKRAKRSSVLDSNAPVGKIGFTIGLASAARYGGLRGTTRYIRRHRRARAVNRKAARRTKRNARIRQREREMSRSRSQR